MVLRRRIGAAVFAVALVRCGPPPSAPASAPTVPVVSAAPVALAESPPEPPPPPASTAAPSAGPATSAPATSPRLIVICNDCGGRPIPILRFQYGSAVVAAEAEPMLREVAEVIKVHPEITLVAVDGHADLNEGKRTAGDVSRRRAEAVRDQLVAKGVEPGRLVVVAHGSTKPLDNNATAAGRARNRRVQVRVQRTKGTP